MLNRACLLLPLLVACDTHSASPPAAATATPAVSAAPVASASAVASTRPAEPPPAPRAQLVPIVFAGHRAPRNAVWTKGGFAFVTHDELWRVSVKNELSVQMTKLSRPIGHDAPMGATNASLVVAAGLDDGSVDVFRGAAKLRTIPAKPADGGPLQLRVADGGRSIAVTRSNGTWPERTTVYDAETGTEQAQVEGGNIAFDATGAFITARGGLYALSDGRRIYEWKEGFYVLGSNGMVPLAKVPMGSEMVAQDYTARAFVKGRAVFAGFGDVVVVDPATGNVVTHAASCGPNKRKRRSHIDVAHGRVFGVCADAVLVTDVESGATVRIAGGTFSRSSFPPDMTMLPGGETLLVQDLDLWVVDPQARSVAHAPGELRALAALDKRCSGRSMARVDMPCTTPGLSDDGAYRLGMRDGVELVRVADGKTAWSAGGFLQVHATLAPRGAAFDVFDGMANGAPSYRIGAGDPGPPLPGATEACGKDTQSLKTVIRGATVFTGYSGGRQTACICQDAGCKAFPVPGSSIASVLGAAADGRLLSGSTNSTMTESTLVLSRGTREVARTKVTGNCEHAAFAEGHIFVSCEPQPLQEAWLLDLDAQTLAVKGRRMSPLGGISALYAGIDSVAVMGGAGSENVATVVSFDWVTDANAKAIATHHLGRTGYVTEHGASLEVAGDADDVLANARCWNGERLFGVDACRSELLMHP